MNVESIASSTDRNSVKRTGRGGISETLREKMMRLEEETVDGIYDHLADADHRQIESATAAGDTMTAIETRDGDEVEVEAESEETRGAKLRSSRGSIRIFPVGDTAPDPLSEIDPGYDGVFPLDPRTWLFSHQFRNFLLGESVRAFRILRGGFAGSHSLKLYEENLCRASQDDIVVIDS
uniref:Uncharacterized protein n=1 Tax=Proboscia inermis TaxID=420281 RepID=A0A7S0CMG8_9STRA|mmetsp:Transcript_9150/g.9262  ORF Transcript_9150/g.9262 Transcript_9150/m.9262 type:complete len:179 (+) Transcript_9150:3-539(+)